MYPLCTTNTGDVPLVETVPVSIVQSSLRNTRRSIIWTVVVLCCVMTFLGAKEALIGWPSAVVGGLCLALPGILLAVGFASAMRHELTTRIPTVGLIQDELTVRYGNRVLTTNIKDCRLWRGRACMMRLPGCPRLHCYRSTILIDFPPASALLLGSRVRVAVGYTDEMCDRWEHALSDAYGLTSTRS